MSPYVAAGPFVKRKKSSKDDDDDKNCEFTIADPPTFQFTSSPGLLIDVTDASPLGFFKLLPTMVMVERTNNYAEKPYWKLLLADDQDLKIRN